MENDLTPEALGAVASRQRHYDEAHGWDAESRDIGELLLRLNRDLIGLVGETGEFANLVKKVNLEFDYGDLSTAEELMEEFREQLSAEVVDMLVYTIRLAGHLDVNLTAAYAAKLKINRAKHARFETS